MRGVSRLMGTQRWPKILLRAFGVGNLFHAVVGAYFLVDGLARFLRRTGDPTVPYETSAYYTRWVVNLVFVALLLPSGALLLRLRRRGITFSNYLFGSEIAYFLGSAAMELALSMSKNHELLLLGHSLAATAGIGNMGTALQLTTAYPLVALLALNLARRRLDRASFWPAPTASEPSQHRT